MNLIRLYTLRYFDFDKNSNINLCKKNICQKYPFGLTEFCLLVNITNDGVSIGACLEILVHKNYKSPLKAREKLKIHRNACPKSLNFGLESLSDTTDALILGMF